MNHGKHLLHCPLSPSPAVCMAGLQSVLRCWCGYRFIPRSSLERKYSPGYKEPTLTLSNTAFMLVLFRRGLNVLCVCFNNRMWCWRLSGLLFSCCLKALSSDLSSTTTSKTSETTSFWHSTNYFSTAWIIILLTLWHPSFFIL